MRKLRAMMDGPYGRWIMLGMLIFFLVILGVNDDVLNYFQGGGGTDNRGEVAGRFSVVGGDPVEVTYAEFDVARARLGRGARVVAGETLEHDLDVWELIVLREAARRQGITVSNEEIAEVLQARIRPLIFNDRPAYRQFVENNFRVDPVEFEESVRDYLEAMRVREVYSEVFQVGPPASRETVVEQLMRQQIENVRVTYAALDAERFHQDAEDELKAKEDPVAALKEFFERDPAVKLDTESFRNPRRVKVEML
jgi:hypothetical protein